MAVDPFKQVIGGTNQAHVIFDKVKSSPGAQAGLEKLEEWKTVKNWVTAHSNLSKGMPADVRDNMAALLAKKGKLEALNDKANQLMGAQYDAPTLADSPKTAPVKKTDTPTVPDQGVKGKPSGLFAKVASFALSIFGMFKSLVNKVGDRFFTDKKPIFTPDSKPEPIKYNAADVALAKDGIAKAKARGDELKAAHQSAEPPALKPAPKAQEAGTAEEREPLLPGQPDKAETIVVRNPSSETDALLRLNEEILRQMNQDDDKKIGS